MSDEPIVDAECGDLMTALLGAQREAPALLKKAEAKIESQKGSYKYKFTPLNVLMEAIQPVLTKQGLVWMTFPCFDDQRRPALKYRLCHAPSRETVEETMPLVLTKLDDPKSHGSAITYARRYSITAVLNLRSEDDDGKAASKPATAQGRVGPGNGGEVSARPAQATERLATAKQRGLINARCAEKGLPPTALADIVIAASESEAKDWESQTDAEGWLKRALDRLPARLVDPIIEGIGRAPSEAEV